MPAASEPATAEISPGTGIVVRAALAQSDPERLQLTAVPGDRRVCPTQLSVPRGLAAKGWATKTSRDLRKIRKIERAAARLLTPEGLDAWKQAGQVVHDDFGSRVMAARLAVKDAKRRKLNIFLVSAYAPTSDAAPAEKAQFFNALDACIARKEADDILMIGMDGNSSVVSGKSKTSGKLEC